MCRLCHELLFILQMLSQLWCKYDVTPSTFMGAYNITQRYDINKVTERIKFSLRWKQDVEQLNCCSRFLFTFTEIFFEITYFRSMHEYRLYHYCSADTCKKDNNEKCMVLKYQTDFLKIYHPEIMCPRCNLSLGQKTKLVDHLVKCGTKEKP